MLSRRIAAARPLARAIRGPPFRPTAIQLRRISQANIEEIDPNQNGMYPNPPPVRRQFRDPYYPWFDRQDRRDYGEPVHEDNDILTVFTPEEYTHFKPGWGLVLLGSWIASVFGLCGVVYLYYPDKPSAPRTFEAGLEEELGGKGAVRARRPGEDQH